MVTYSISQLTRMTNTELLQAIDIEASFSPVINLLCDRLRVAQEEVDCVERAFSEADCPVCRSTLSLNMENGLSGESKFVIKPVR